MAAEAKIVKNNQNRQDKDKRETKKQIGTVKKKDAGNVLPKGESGEKEKKRKKESLV